MAPVREDDSAFVAQGEEKLLPGTICGRFCPDINPIYSQGFCVCDVILDIQAVFYKRDFQTISCRSAPVKATGCFFVLSFGIPSPI